MEASPVKRRVLGALDVNIASPNSRGSVSHGKLDGGRALASPLKLHRDAQGPAAAAVETTPDSKKRALAAAETTQQPAKKARHDEPTSGPRRGLAEAGTKVDNTAEETPDNSQAARERSVSPGASSLSDSPGLDSTVDTSQATAITEPDADANAAAHGVPEVFSRAALPPPPPRRKLTREEWRHKAEILKLRLGLANYKVRTGQADVPLDKLQVRPYPGMKRRLPALAEQRPLPAARTTERPSLGGRPAREAMHEGSVQHNEPQQDGDVDLGESEGDEEEDDDDDDGDEAPIAHSHSVASSPEKSLLPRTTAAFAAATPQRRRLEADEERLTSSALRGGAASGLLSLSRSQIS